MISIGEGFGELALLYSAPRSASIKAKEPSFLWGIDRVTFRKVVEEMVAKDYEVNRNFIEDIAFFREWNPKKKNYFHLINRKPDGCSEERTCFGALHPEIFQGTGHR